MFVLLFLFCFFSFQLANNDFFQALNDRRVFQTDVVTYSIEELVAVASEHTPKNTVRIQEQSRSLFNFTKFSLLGLFCGSRKAFKF